MADGNTKPESKPGGTLLPLLRNWASLFPSWLTSSPPSVDLEQGIELDERSSNYENSPPIEESCYSLNESSFSKEGNCVLQLTKNNIRHLLTEHMRTLGGRVQLLEDLEGGKINASTLKRDVAGYKRQEINALLLYASFLGHEDLIPELKNYGADINHAEHFHGLTALHLCALNDSLSGVRYLFENGVDVNSEKLRLSFHYAAFGNSAKVAKYFLDHGVSQDYPEDEDEDSVLNSAARCNALDVLKLLDPKGSNLNRLDSKGCAPIHYVAKTGDAACLAQLLNAGCHVDLRTKKGDTALHLAAEAGCSDNLGLLVDKGADVNLKNHRDQTALHLAARSRSFECVEILLRKADPDVNAEDYKKRTPLHLALERPLHALNMTVLLLARRANVNKADTHGYTPIHLAAMNAISRCVDLLIKHDADLSAKTTDGTTALSIILRKTPTSLDIFKQRLDASITLVESSSFTDEVQLKLNFHPLQQHQQQAKICYLHTFVKEGYKEILEHPLCQAFLHLKWQKVRLYYVGLFIVYLLNVIAITTMVIFLLADDYNDLNHFVDNKIELRCGNENFKGAVNFFQRKPLFGWSVVTLLSVADLFCMIFRNGLSVSKFKNNMISWCTAIGISISYVTWYFDTCNWHKNVGAFTILWGWSNLMLMMGQFPMFVPYVKMFTSVQAKVFNLLLVYSFLFVGFIASFYVLFPYSKAFNNPFTGLIKVLVMMTGELDFENLLFPPDVESSKSIDTDHATWFLYQVLIKLMFALFLFFVTIVLMNLIVGIAVDDIKGLQKTAGLAKLIRQMKMVVNVESKQIWIYSQLHCLNRARDDLLAVGDELKVEPLNPREKRLPNDVLTAGYKVASRNLSSKNSNTTACTCLNSDGNSTIRFINKKQDHATQTDSGLGHGAGDG